VVDALDLSCAPQSALDSATNAAVAAHPFSSTDPVHCADTALSATLAGLGGREGARKVQCGASKPIIRSHASSRRGQVLVVCVPPPNPSASPTMTTIATVGSVHARNIAPRPFTVRLLFH
jgi:hypothetical protein